MQTIPFESPRSDALWKSAAAKGCILFTSLFHRFSPANVCLQSSFKSAFTSVNSVTERDPTAFSTSQASNGGWLTGNLQSTLSMFKYFWRSNLGALHRSKEKQRCLASSLNSIKQRTRIVTTGSSMTARQVPAHSSRLCWHSRKQWCTRSKGLPVSCSHLLS